MNNKMSGLNYLFLWFGASISIAEIITGGLLSTVGFKTGVYGIIIGHLIGTAILAAGGYMGVKTKMPSIESTKISFGIYGTYLFGVLNVLQLIGWTIVMIISGSQSLNQISKQIWGFDNIYMYSIVIGILICLWITFGIKGFKIINTVAVILLLGLTIVLSTIVFKNSELFNTANNGSISFGILIELSVIMPLSWLPLIADYTRFAKSKKGAVLGSFLGYFIGSSWMYIIGLSLGIISGTASPGAFLVAANLSLTAFGIIVLSTVTTTFLDVYSAGVSGVNIFKKVKEKNLALVVAVISTILALVVPMQQYENFLYAIGSVFGPLFAIVLTDFFLFKNTKYNGDKVNKLSFIVWIVGVIVYYILKQYNIIFGLTVPVIIITSIIYIITKKIYLKRAEL